MKKIMTATNMRKMVAVAALACTPMIASADKSSGCGWGTSVMEGQSGLLAHLLAGLTNSTSGSNVFGMTSGTAGCDVSGPVNQASLFIDTHKESVAFDMSRGQGESLAALSQILNIEESERAEFGQLVQNNFASIFDTASAAGGAVAASLFAVMSSNAKFAKYAL
mgnify:CR=1 FL=1